MTNYLKIILTLILYASSTLLSAQLTVGSGDKKIAYQGRIGFQNDHASFFWPGSSATIHFEGNGAKATLKTLRGDAYFYVITDGNEAEAYKIHTDTITKTYVLASGLPQGRHSVQLFQLTNNTTETLFYGFELSGDTRLLKPARPPKRKIEFYGNSITAGHGVDVPDGGKDSGAPEFFDNYYTYAALTARHYNAQYSCIARSGIGVTISWFPEIMPEVYDRLRPSDRSSKWDFSRYQPDIVVINLFQNDSWLVNQPEHEQFKARFGTQKPGLEFIVQAYENLVKSIRSKYPKASIICALGNMDATRKGSAWPGYIETAVSHLKDKKIYTCFFPFKDTPGHPRKSEQQLMANELIQFIDRNLKW